MFAWLSPKPALTPRDVDRGLRMLLFSGSFGQIMVSLTGGAFLVAFALLLGASNKTIGVLSAIGPLAQVVQIPSVFLVDRTRRRKLLVVLGAGVVRIGWVVVALVPWLAPEPARLPMLLGLLLVLSCFASMVGCAFNSWIRDLVPEERMGSYFARRMAVSIAVGAVFSLAAGVGIDQWKGRGGDELVGYAILFGAGALFGLLGELALMRTPEPLMPESRDRGMLNVLAQPFKDGNYRQLMYFLGSWAFATSFAGPFFMVYMRQRLNLNMTWILGLVVLSQLTNVVFFKLWGRMADRFTNKSVLTVSGPLFIITFVMWPFTTMPTPHVLTKPILVAIHVLAGMSTAGVLLCANNLALKIAPKGRSTAYLATNSLVSGLAAAVAPVVAGIVADAFGSRELTLQFRWGQVAAETASLEFQAVSLRGLDFVFIIAFVLGMYSLHRLIVVREEGEVKTEIVRAEFYGEMRRAARQISTVGGMRDLIYFPFIKLREAASQVADAVSGNHHKDDGKDETPQDID